MTDPSPYEQGFRDALLSVKASITDLLTSTNGDDITEEEHRGIEMVGKPLDSLINQKNHDLWNILALAQVDSAGVSESAPLRRMLRAPSGILIDTLGRMLYVRLNGADYDTGVNALLVDLEREKLGSADLASMVGALCELFEWCGDNRRIVIRKEDGQAHLEIIDHGTGWQAPVSVAGPFRRAAVFAAIVAAAHDRREYQSPVSG